MGKTGGFLEYVRQSAQDIEPLERIKHYNEFHLPLSKEERQKQGARCMDCGVPFCQFGQVIEGMPSGCPLNNMIPEWNDLLFRDNYEAALKRLLQTDPFPEFTSRVCPSPCEKACTCALNGDAVTICENEKSIIEYAFEKGWMSPLKNLSRTDKKIAIIGSGPSGLACAWQLNRRGHNVVVFERNDYPGGLLMYGIPNMKLDKDIVKRRIDLMKEEGISFFTNKDIATKQKAMKVLAEFDAVVLACGAGNARDIQVEGRDANGIHLALDFLTDATKVVCNQKTNESISAKNKHVLVIGGGDTGNDCVGTSIRQGCKSVIQLEMMPELPKKRLESNPWPEWPKVLKTDYGQEEAIALYGKDPRVYQTTVKTFFKDKQSHVNKAELINIAWTEDEKTGRMKMEEVEGSAYTVDCDLVLIAAGFTGVKANVAAAFEVDLDERTNIKTTANTYTTKNPKVFAAGDARRGQSLVVWAIKEGKEVARAVDEFLMGYTNI